MSLYKSLKYKFVQNSESPWNKKKTKRNTLESVSIISCTMKDYFFSCTRNTFAFWRSMNKFSDFYEFLMIQMATPPFSNLQKKCILLFILLLEYITMKLLMVHFDLIICQDVIGLSSCRFRIYKFDAFCFKKGSGNNFCMYLYTIL